MFHNILLIVSVQEIGFTSFGTEYLMQKVLRKYVIPPDHFRGVLILKGLMNFDPTEKSQTIPTAVYMVCVRHNVHLTPLCNMIFVLCNINVYDEIRFIFVFLTCLPDLVRYKNNSYNTRIPSEYFLHVTRQSDCSNVVCPVI